MMCQFDHIAITVEDLDRSSKWYCQHFGFKEVSRFEKPALAVNGATLKLESFVLELLEPYHPQVFQKMNGGLNSCLGKIGANHIAFRVENVGRFYQILKDNQTHMISKLIDSRYFFCLDLDCVLLEIRQQKK